MEQRSHEGTLPTGGTEPQRPSTGESPALQASYEALVRSHRAAFERLARRLARNTEDAEDLLQETLLDAYRAFGRFRSDSHFYSWVARIMTNNYLDRVRRKQCPTVPLDLSAAEEDGATLDLPDETANPERLMLWDTLDHPYQSALDALQPVHRATVMLCDLNGATYEEAAAAEECPIGTIRSRLHRAHNYIRDFLASFVPGAEATPAPAPVPHRRHSRRAFLRMGTAAAAAAGAAALTQIDPEEAQAHASRVRVRVWAGRPLEGASVPAGVEALLASLRHDPTQEAVLATAAPTAAELEATDVLLLWDDGEKTALPAEVVRAIAHRVRHEGMGLIAAHSADESPVLKAVLAADRVWSSPVSLEAAPLELRVTAPRHPIAHGLNAFRLETADRATGQFVGPKPDIVLLDAAAGNAGERAWQGMVWTAGKGRVFYFQPGHAAFPVFQHQEVQQMLRNAASWCAGR